jgi:hypothetical protein
MTAVTTRAVEELRLANLLFGFGVGVGKFVSYLIRFVTSGGYAEKRLMVSLSANGAECKSPGHRPGVPVLTSVQR